VINGGPENELSNSGNIALLIFFFILLINSVFFFSIKKTGCFPPSEIFFAIFINPFKDQLFFLYSFPCVMEKPIYLFCGSNFLASSKYNLSIKSILYFINGIFISNNFSMSHNFF